MVLNSLALCSVHKLHWIQHPRIWLHAWIHNMAPLPGPACQDQGPRNVYCPLPALQASSVAPGPHTIPVQPCGLGPCATWPYMLESGLQDSILPTRSPTCWDWVPMLPCVSDLTHRAMVLWSSPQTGGESHGPNDKVGAGSGTLAWIVYPCSNPTEKFLTSCIPFNRRYTYS